MPTIATKIMMNIGNPQLGFDFAQLRPNSGWVWPDWSSLSTTTSTVHPKTILDYPEVDADLKKPLNPWRVAMHRPERFTG